MATVTLTQPDTLDVVTDSLNNVSCNGAADGAIYVSVTGGTAPYTYSWSSTGGLSAAPEDIEHLGPNN